MLIMSFQFVFFFSPFSQFSCLLFVTPSQCTCLITYSYNYIMCFLSAPSEVLFHCGPFLLFQCFVPFPVFVGVLHCLLIRIRFASATKQKSGCWLIGAKVLLLQFLFYFIYSYYYYYYYYHYFIILFYFAGGLCFAIAIIGVCSSVSCKFLDLKIIFSSLNHPSMW
jgi:hypothetical protein